MVGGKGLEALVAYMASVDQRLETLNTEVGRITNGEIKIQGVVTSVVCDTCQQRWVSWSNVKTFAATITGVNMLVGLLANWDKISKWLQ